MAKNYATISATYQAQNGLIKVYVKDPSTGQHRLNLVTEKQAKSRGLPILK